MANLHAAADGNFTTAATWVTGASVHQQLSVTNTTSITTSYVYCATAIIANGAVVDGVLMALRLLTSTGTVSVSLHNGSSDIREVTINASDLVLDSVATCRAWVFFKFGSTVTGDGSTTYKIGVKSSSAANVSVYRSSTTADWTRSLRTTTAPGAGPAAADILLIAGEYTAAATYTARTVTMNQTASTDYGSGTAGSVGMVIGQRATLTYDISQTTVLRMSGNIELSPYGTLALGTPGSPVPRAFNAVLEFDCAADGDYSIVHMGGTLYMQGESRTSGKNVVFCKLDANLSAAGSALTVDRDTGWKDTDEIAIASTSTTRTQHERKILSGDAGGSSMNITVAVTNAHLGSGDTKGGVILLTRNVILRTVNTSFNTHLYTACGSSVVDLDWAALKNSGWVSGTGSGCHCAMHSSASGSFTANYTVIDGSHYNGFNFTGSFPAVITDCSAYNLSSTGATEGAIATSSNMLGINLQIERFYAIHCPQGLYQPNNLGASSYIKNVYIAGATNHGIRFVPSGSAPFKLAGSYDNWEVHGSSSGSGLQVSGAAHGPFTLDTWNVWAMTGGSALTVASSCANIKFSNWKMFGCAPNMTVSSSMVGIVWENCQFDGLSSPASQFGLYLGGTTPGSVYILRFVNCEFSNGASPKQAHTVNDISTNFSEGNFYFDITLEDCILGASTPISSKFYTDIAVVSDLTSALGLMTPDVVDGGQRLRWSNTTIGGRTHGTIVCNRGRQLHNTSTYHTAAPSEELVPISSTLKLASGVRRVPVLSAAAASVSVWVRKDGSYNGNAPRLIQRAHSALGLTETVLNTLSVGANTWEELVGITGAVAADGVVQFYVDCDGTAGSVFVDDWTV